MSCRLLVGLLPALIAVSGWSQVAPKLTEVEFLAALDVRHPAMAEAAEALAAARADALSVSTLENPVLAVVREEPDGSSAQTDWTLSWALPHLRRGADRRARGESVAAAEAQLEHELLSLRLAMQESFAEWALAVARRDRLSTYHERVRALAQREKARAVRGESSGLVAHRILLAATELEARVVLVEAATEAARARARSWSAEFAADAEPLLPELAPPPEALASHPLERAAEAEVAAALSEGDAADRFLPSPELMLGWQRQEEGPDSLDGPLLGLSWSVPLFARNQGERALAAARVAAARGRLERTRRELSSARSASEESFRRLSTALTETQAALAPNDAMLRAAEAAFRQGEAGVTDFLEMLRSVTESEMMVLGLYEAALAAQRELERFAAPRALSLASTESDRKDTQP